MHPHAAKIGWFLALGAAFAAFCGQAGHAAPARPGDSVVLLHNGNVLVGRVSLENDRYVISQPHGVLRIPRQTVRTVCGSLDEAYQHQRQGLRPGDTDALCKLIAWGLRHGLTQQCETDLRSLDPQDRRRAVLERRLAAARIESSPKRPDRKVQQAAHNEPAPPEPEDPLQDARWLRRVPQKIRGEFVARVQPILGRGCGASGCHAPDTGQTFQIDRLAIDGAGHAAVTTTNLRRLFELLTADAEAAGRLMDHAGRPHGPVGARPSQPLNARQQTIVGDWLGSVMQEVETRVAAKSVDPVAVGVVPGRVEFQGPSFSGSSVAPAVQPERPAQQPPPPASPPRAADPFDPERFNRRHHPER